MIHFLENSKMKISVNDFGAELMSIYDKEADTEYLFDGDTAFWGRRSPILFPFVGALHQRAYRHNHIQYPMTNHGFARDMNFTLQSKDDTELWHVLSSSSETLGQYPFSFRLEAGYRLEEKQITVLWNVFNTGKEELFFSIGAHPAFCCPLKNYGAQTDYYICFHGTDKLNISLIDTKSGLLLNAKKPLSLEAFSFPDGSPAGLLKITKELFDEDALVIEQDQVHRVSLLKPDKTPYISVGFDAPLFGLWSKAGGGAPFICIEPWYGRCDVSGFMGELKEKEYINKLEAGGRFCKEYTICCG